jgi:glycosyltransferase involved in cell wall biosynthesis
MAVYNGRRFLLEQVESVLAQLEPGDELVVVDDGSTDDSVALLAALDSPYIRLFSNPSNLGVIGAFQRGMRLARHSIIFLCDQDDIWLPGKRAAYVAEFARDPRVWIVISDAQMIDENGALVSESYMTVRGGFNPTVLGTLWRNRYLGCAMAVRRPLLEVALPIPGNVPMHDMWLGALGRFFGRTVYLPTPYMQHRRHGRNASPWGSNSWLQIFYWRVVLTTALLQRGLRFALGRHHDG